MLPAPESLHRTVLLIVEEKTLREPLIELLELTSIHVLTTNTCKESIKYYQRHRQEIDLILLDVRAPAGKDIDTLAALQKIDPLVKVILVSGYARQDIAYPLTDNSLFFLRKPFSMDELLQVMDELIQQ